MIKVGDSAIVNTDDVSELELAKTLNMIVLTCGLHLNSTVTASSIDEDGFMFCLQRSIYTLSQRQIHPQEFKVLWAEKPGDMFIPLAYVTLLLLCDVNPDVFKIIRF